MPLLPLLPLLRLRLWLGGAGQDDPALLHSERGEFAAAEPRHLSTSANKSRIAMEGGRASHRSSFLMDGAASFGGEHALGICLLLQWLLMLPPSLSPSSQEVSTNGRLQP